MLHHPNVTPKMARMLTLFSQFSSRYITSKVLPTWSPMHCRPSVTLPALTRSENNDLHVHDCSSLCAHRDAHIRRHGIQLAVLCMLPSLYKDLL